MRSGEFALKCSSRFNPEHAAMRLFLSALAVACALSCTAQIHAQPEAAEMPEANPGRPTVSTPATLTPVGYLQFENGGLYAVSSSEFGKQLGINQVTKLTVAPRLELLVSSEPFSHTIGAIGEALPENLPGDVDAGLQAVVLPGVGLKPTISLSYFRVIYSGSAPDTDIGSFHRSALFLLSEDFGRFHVDMNGVFSEQTGNGVRRGQFGQTLSISHPLGRFTAAGELWHFTQPLTHGNAVGNLWALSYTAKKNLVFDAGLDRGLTSSSTQWEGFAGLTYLLPHRLWRSQK
jgi:hypothetical protein